MRIAVALLFSLAPSIANATTTHLRLSDEVGDETVDPLIASIEDAPAEKGDVLILEINSPGGDVYAGFRLVKAIENYAATSMCIVDGEADSMASYIAVSCDLRAMTRRSLMMIHQPGRGMRGQLNDMKNVVEELRASAMAMAEHYALHVHGINALELVAKIDGGRQWWLGWQEAQRLGAVDIVVDRVDDLLEVR